MKLLHLLQLVKAAELGLPYFEHPHAKHDAQVAIDAAYVEAQRRKLSRELSRAHRPSRTVRREAIREQLLLTYHKVRLTRAGHCLQLPGCCLP